MRLDRDSFADWIARYERAWRTPGIEMLETLFAPGASYSMGPFEQPVVGIEAIGELWDGEREGPDEPFTMSSEVLAVEANTGIARVDVRYERDPPQRWLDIWIVRFDDAGLCIEFDEWPFAPPEQE